VGVPVAGEVVLEMDMLDLLETVVADVVEILPFEEELDK
jgi:hypothetical protein